MEHWPGTYCCWRDIECPALAEFLVQLSYLQPGIEFMLGSRLRFQLFIADLG